MKCTNELLYKLTSYYKNTYNIFYHNYIPNKSNLIYF